MSHVCLDPVASSTLHLCCILLSYFLLFSIFLNWNIVALQCCVSAVQQSESAVVYTYPLFNGLASQSGHHKAFSTVPCAIWSVLITYLFSTQYQQCIHVNPSLLGHPTYAPFRPWCPYVCFLHLRVCFSFAIKIVYTIFLDSTYMH